MKEQIEAVQRMQAYIDKHLSEEITLGDLSKVSFFSPWHSYRLFLKWTKLSPSDYIRRLRLSRSALALRDQKVRVIDVALSLGFKSVDGYQRAFFREFGCNPGEYAKNPVPIYLFTPFFVENPANRKETNMEKTKHVFIQQAVRPARKVIIKRGKAAEDYFSYCEEVGCDVWGLLLSIKSISNEPQGMWLTETYKKPGTSTYVQGVEVSLDYEGVVPEGFDVITLPETTYFMFMGEPFEEEDYCIAIEQIWEAIKTYDPKVMGYAYDTKEPKIQLEPIGERGYIELVPVRKL